jgi:hypothetical protein
MAGSFFVSALAIHFGWLTAGSAVEPNKIDRAILKEPVYHSQMTKYCLLVFGRAIKTRVWVVRDGDDLYVDTNGNGNLTEPAKKYCAGGENFRPFEITDMSGLARYRVSLVKSFEAEGVTRLYAEIEIIGKFKQLGGSPMRARVQDTAVVHFDGPLRMAPFQVNGAKRDKLAAGKFPKGLFVVVETDEKESGCWVRVRSAITEKDNYFPADVHPLVKVEFYPVRAGQKSIIQVYELTKRC